MVDVKSNKKKDLVNLLYGLIILLLVNLISVQLFFRLDLTSEKRYTLSDATKQMIENLNDVVFVKVYLDGELPAGFQRLRNATKEMLDEFRAISKINIQYEFIDPSADQDPKVRTSVYKQLSKAGLQYTNLEYMDGDVKKEKIIFPGAIFSYNGKEIPLQLLKSKIGASPEEMLNNSVQQLEFEFASTIRQLTLVEKPVIAFIEGHGELDEFETMDISKELEKFYTVKRIRLNSQLNALQGVQAAIIAKPDSVFHEQDKFIIDQFIMKGGRVLWLLDPLETDHDSLQKNTFTFALARSLNIEDQLFKYGARVNQDLVMDMQSTPIPVIVGYIGNQPQSKMFPWFYHPLVIPQLSHPIVKNLNAIHLKYASSIDSTGADNIKKTVLLTTSKYVRVQQSPIRVSLNILREEPDIRQYSKSERPLALLLEGEFTSIFKNRLPQQIAESNLIAFAEKSKPTRQIVIGDGDVIKNDIQYSTGKPIPLGYDKFTDRVYANKNFILNCINFLTNDDGLLDLRGKEIKLRLLDKASVNKQKNNIIFLNIFLPILLIVLLGILLNLIRKRKYATK
jgi:ABC-2 type transport system permease protein